MKEMMKKRRWQHNRKEGWTCF